MPKRALSLRHPAFRKRFLRKAQGELLAWLDLQQDEEIYQWKKEHLTDFDYLLSERGFLEEYYLNTGSGDGGETLYDLLERFVINGPYTFGELEKIVIEEDTYTLSYQEPDDLRIENIIFELHPATQYEERDLRGQRGEVTDPYTGEKHWVLDMWEYYQKNLTEDEMDAPTSSAGIKTDRGKSTHGSISLDGDYVWQADVDKIEHLLLTKKRKP